ncbi:MAG TPA: lysine 2,3-aminomutase, partial [Pseudolabrys sp.]
MTITSKALRTPADLCARGLVPPERQPDLDAVVARYAVALPEPLSQLIDPNDPDDPIARQFVPDPAELEHQAVESADPIG